MLHRLGLVACYSACLFFCIDILGMLVLIRFSPCHYSKLCPLSTLYTLNQLAFWASHVLIRKAFVVFIYLLRILSDDAI